MLLKKFWQPIVERLLVAPVLSYGWGNGVGSTGGELGSGISGIVCEVCGASVVAEGDWEVAVTREDSVGVAVLESVWLWG